LDGQSFPIPFRLSEDMENDITGILIIIVLIVLFIGQELGLYEEINED
jgi:hypothetical protein